MPTYYPVVVLAVLPRCLVSIQGDRHLADLQDRVTVISVRTVDVGSDSLPCME